MSLPLSGLEFTTEQDEFFDYCLWAYKPAMPYLNKFRSVNLLLHSFDCAGLGERSVDLVHTIREGMGLARTVWGIKHRGDTIGWEFYFYDYRRGARERSMTRLLDALGPSIACPIIPNELCQYFMFSIDIDADLVTGRRGLDEIHMYIGNPGSTVSSGICYSLTPEGTKLENFYFFFDAQHQLQDILSKIACSAFVGTEQVDLDRILWPELRNCRIIVVANKQGNDCIYFSRITVDQLLFFLRSMTYPKRLVDFVEEHRSKLDHLLYDVGFDYRMEGGRLRILKSGYYGFF